MKKFMVVSLLGSLVLPVVAGAQIKSITDADSVAMVGSESRDHLEMKTADLETQFSNMTNAVEKLSHQIDLLEKKLDKLNADYDVRFKMLENANATAQTAKAVPSAVKSASVGVAPSSGAKAKTADNVKQPLNTKANAGTAKVSGTNDAKAAYDAAYAKVQKHDYAGAEKAFVAFIKDYPNNKLEGNAYYWLGEVFYARKDYAKAAVAFADGYQKHPTEAKAADSFFKLGLAMEGMGRMDEACTVFSSFLVEYPNASANMLTRVKKEASKLKCK